MKHLKEYEYINAPENNMELWIVEKDNPEMFVGYINSLSKEVAMHLNIFLQKAGFKCVHSRPESCAYARGIPAKYLLGDKTYIEWSSDEKISEAIQTVKDNLKLKATKVNKNPLKTVKAKQFFESKLNERDDGEIWTDSKGKTWKYQKGTKDQQLDYDVNENVPDRAKFRAYKMFRTKYDPNNPKTFKYKGKLFPLYINAKDSYEIGKWYKAGHGDFKILCNEKGEPILDKSGNPTCKTIEKDLAYRPGLHMGSLPIMRQRGRSDLPHTPNDFDYFHSQEVFAEVEYAGVYDYTEKSKERQRNSAEPDNPYSAGFSNTSDFENGFYKFKTNTNAPDDEVWLITDAMKIIRVLTDEEVAEIIKKSGTTIKPQVRGNPNGKDGDMFIPDFSQFKLTESRVKTTKNHNNIVEALRAAIASFQSIGVQVQLIEELFGKKTLDVSYGPYHVFFDTLDDDGLYDGYGKYLLTLPLANEPSVQWIGGNENELFTDLKDVFNVLDKIMTEPIKDGRNFAD